MFNMFYFVFLVQVTLYLQCVLGDDPLNSFFSALECYGTAEENCPDGENKNFTEKYPNVSRSFDNSTEAATRFYLFTKNNTERPEQLQKCGGLPPKNTNFDPSCKTLIVVPGFVSGICNMAIFKELVHERMKCGCYNYIHVEWTWGNSFDLKSAVNNVPIVANQIVIVIKIMKKKFNLTSTVFICAGHSLGAHICGLVGQGTPIDVIHAMDPAGVSYNQSTPEDKRLSPTDAKCVMVIHSNGGQCLPFFFGLNFSVGTKDFWPNGGLCQPGYLKQILINILKLDFFYAMITLYPTVYYHFYSLQLYKQSMCPKNCTFIGEECTKATPYRSLIPCEPLPIPFFSKTPCDYGTNSQQRDIMGADSCELCGNGTGKNYYVKTSGYCPYCTDPITDAASVCSSNP